jgi:(p)ppGpp synthase/HD superfamily hydrolase
MTFGHNDYDLFMNAMHIAISFHRGHTREDGSDYVFHPISVMVNCPNNITIRIVALLHDVLEDTTYSVWKLRREFPMIVSDAVELLTRSNKIPYEKYIEQLKSDNIAVVVKIQDLLHNLSTIDNIKPKPRREKLRLRYTNALYELGYTLI